jgi:hypothetical protein
MKGLMVSLLFFFVFGFSAQVSAQYIEQFYDEYRGQWMVCDKPNPNSSTCRNVRPASGSVRGHSSHSYEPSRSYDEYSNRGYGYRDKVYRNYEPRDRYYRDQRHDSRYHDRYDYNSRETHSYSRNDYGVRAGGWYSRYPQPYFNRTTEKYKVKIQISGTRPYATYQHRGRTYYYPGRHRYYW